MKIGVLLFLTAICFGSGPDRNHKNYEDNSLLFCIVPYESPLTLNRFNKHPITGHEELDAFFSEKNVLDILPWIPFAEESDRDGDIFLNRIYRILFSDKRADDIETLKIALQSLSMVQSVEFHRKRKPYFTPNDPMYNQQWFLQQIGSNSAWDNWQPNSGNSPSGEDILLASVDTGVDWDHTDLRNNLWQNLNEDADGDGHTIEYSGGQWILDPGDLNGIDDDNWDNNPDTFIDDLIGWDLSGWNGVEDNNPQPRQGANNYGTWAHGTHVAGLLAASTHNGTGIASTAFDCKIMSVKVSEGTQSYPYITHGYAGILYAAKAGFYSGSYAIINNSWGGGGFSNYEQSVINLCHNTYNAMIFAAAGNGADDGWGEEYAPHYPASYEHVISVTASGTGDVWNHWATYHETVDLIAPGENIRSCVIGNNYSNWDGTSMATPVAASCAGLMRIFYQDITNIQVETMLIASADPGIYNVNSEGYLNGMLGSGRVDCEKALEAGLYPSMEFVDMDITVLDGSDDVINPGETIELRTILYNNETWGNAVGLTGELSVEANAFIFQNYANFGDVMPGDAILNIEDPFLIQFPSETPHGDVNFTLSLSSNSNDYMEYTTQLNFTIYVEGGGGEIEIPISFNTGWNLVGLPINENDSYYLTIFPDAIPGTLYGFDFNYVSQEILTPGSGYWIRFAEMGSELVSGTPIQNLTISVNEDWNLISGISTNISVESIYDPENLVIPGTFYGFNNSYYSVDLLSPGQGYWVRSQDDGQILLNTQNVKLAEKPELIGLKTATKLHFMNSMGSWQTLYVGKGITKENSLSLTFPPLPPSGENVFDVRFEGNLKASETGGNISIVNSHFPITLKTESGDDGRWRITIMDEDREMYFDSGSNEDILIESNLISIIKDIDYSSLAKIDMNVSAYPNPFNQSTTFTFELPVGTHVSLTVFDILGNEVISLVNEFKEKGVHKISWHGNKKVGNVIETGVYFASVETEYFSDTEKILIVK
jgi:hypothetical protein